MRTLVQPGPVHPDRIDMAGVVLEERHFMLHPGQTLHDGLTAGMAGFTGGTLEIMGGALNPFRYVMPGPPDGPNHVAYFTAPRAPAGTTQLERGNVTFGLTDGAPSLHCHAVWIEPDGARRGGHILPKETVVAAPAEVRAWGFTGTRIETGFDAETNFTLLQLHGTPGPGSVAARVRPNQDITQAVEEIARAAALSDATIRGSLGSLVGARFTCGAVVEDYATEVLVRGGLVRGGVAELDLTVVDMKGRVHEGVLARGENAVLITFDLVLSAA
jgi:predicted DNA-binding protein with PD1-like motif